MIPSGNKTDQFDPLTYFTFIDRPKVALILLILSAIGAGLVGGLLYFQGAHIPGLILLAFCAISLALAILNWAGYVLLAMGGLLWLFPIMLTVLMIDGEGLHDPGMIGFAIYLIFASLLMGKRFIPVAWLVSVVLVNFIYISEVYRLFSWTQDNLYVSSDLDLIIVLVLLTVGAGIFWVIMNIIEGTITRVVAGEEEVKDAYDRTLEGWASALEMRDKETEGHSRRVTGLAVQIGKKMGFSEEALFHLRRGALLHDIGKMAVPDKILHKPGKLTEEEWVVIRQHPEAAYEMLKEIEFLGPAMDIPLYHHEQWDGGGYPRGLSQTEIPLAARIFAVVDNWDALCSDRAYRPAWEREKVIEYIKEQSGKKFDPEVVKIFMGII